LLGNDDEITNYTMAFTRQYPVNSNRGMAFSVQSVPRSFNQDKLVQSVSKLVGELVIRLLRFSCCEKLVAKARNSSGTHYKPLPEDW
jgi:hypothetical protein